MLGREGKSEMAAVSRNTILIDAGKPEVAAAPVASERALTRRTQSGAGLGAGSLPTDDPEFWDNTGDWHSGPDGFFE